MIRTHMGLKKAPEIMVIILQKGRMAYLGAQGAVNGLTVYLIPSRAEGRAGDEVGNLSQVRPRRLKLSHQPFDRFLGNFSTFLAWRQAGKAKRSKGTF